MEGNLAGPAVCIFNEPRDTHPYSQAEWREYLAQNMPGVHPGDTTPKPAAFYSLSYVGVPNGSVSAGGVTNWDPLRAWVIQTMNECEVRSLPSAPLCVAHSPPDCRSEAAASSKWSSAPSTL